MSEIKNEEVEVEEPLDLPAEPAEGEEDTTDWKGEAQKLRDKAIAQRERTRILKQKLKDRDTALEAVASAKKSDSQPKTGELDETQLDYLDLKGISEQEDIDVVQKNMKNTGNTVRQALKDDYVIDKLAKLKALREVKDATPSSTKRPGGGGGGNDLAIALAKYEQSGYKDLPKDFALRSAVINAFADKSDTNKPAWRT